MAALFYSTGVKAMAKRKPKDDPETKEPAPKPDDKTVPQNFDQYRNGNH